MRRRAPPPRLPAPSRSCTPLAHLPAPLQAFHMLKFYNVERKWKRKLEGAVASEREVRRQRQGSESAGGGAAACVNCGLLPDCIGQRTG